MLPLPPGPPHEAISSVLYEYCLFFKFTTSIVGKAYMLCVYLEHPFRLRPQQALQAGTGVLIIYMKNGKLFLFIPIRHALYRIQNDSMEILAV